jgi:hypothetical protein
MKSLFLLIFVLAPAGLSAQWTCNLQHGTLYGAYVVTLTGTAGSPVWGANTGPVATVGRFVFDGQGNFEITTATIVGANPPFNVTPPFAITGTYTVNRDCTGTLTLNFAPNPNGHYNTVVSPDGRQITMISTDKGDVLVATGNRLDRN